MLLPSLLLAAAVAADPAPPDRPNILLLLADDQGWNGTSVPMDPEVDGAASEAVRTPALERLASEGRRFARAYSSAPTCAPTRAALQTGRSPAALGWWGARSSFDGERLTIAELLSEAGYATAHFGKWHLQAGGPGEHGYDRHDGDVGNEAAAKHGPPNPVDIFGMAARAGEFIGECAKEERPFFAQLSWLALHAPQNARPETVERVRERSGGGRARRLQRIALAEDLDEGVGRLLDLLDELEIADETLVIYASDNGGAVSGPRVLRGGKGTLWEGGIRVPFVVRGPRVPKGTVDATPIVLHDLFPTFAELAGAADEVPEDVEGGSLVDVFRGKSDGVERDRDGILFQLTSTASEGEPGAAIVDGTWKLVKHGATGAVELYDLAEDPAEKRDLAAKHEEEAEDLLARLDAWLDVVGSGSDDSERRRRRRDRRRDRDDD